MRSLPVGAGEGHRRRVVVQLAELDVEGANHAQLRLGDEGCPIRVEQAIEHPPNPIVVYRLCVAHSEPEQFRLEGSGPLTDARKRLVRDGDVGYQHRDDDCWVETEPCVVVRQIGVERLC